MVDRHLKPKLELVVARYRENLAWLKKVPRDYAVTVYDKGSGHPEATALPNIGREAHTYLHHLAENYERLAEVTVFVQGHPFDHAPDLHHRLRCLAGGAEQVLDFRWFGFAADTDDSKGRRLFVPWSKNPDREQLDLDGFHRALFGTDGPETYRFFPGAQFAVHRSAITARGGSFYRSARDLAIHYPHGPHCFERCWDRVFGVNGTSGYLSGDQLTAYFKPVRRLANATQPR